VVILDPEKHIMRHFGKDEGMANNLVQDLVEFDGKTWISSNGGLDMIDETKGTLTHIGKKEGLISETVYTIAFDKEKNIYLSGPQQGMVMMDSSLKTLLHAGVANGLSQENILDIKRDNRGNIWVATYGKGIDVIDPVKNTIKNLREGVGLKDSSFRLLLPDDYGRMWIGTDQGIYVADITHNTLTHISTKSGLCNDYVNSLIPYKGSIMIGTIDKVSMVTAPAYTNAADTLWNVSLVHNSEGLVNNSGDWNCNIVTKKGQYFWGDNGISVLNEIKPESDSETTFVAGISIMSQHQNFTNKLSLNEHDTIWNGDSAYVKGQKISNIGYPDPAIYSWDSISGAYNLPVNLEMPYNHNYLQFQFAQMHLGRHDTTSYCYTLEGIDDHWIITSNPFSENYLNLSPGKYTLKVSSKNISGTWTQPATFSFTIRPPWWKSWWIYIIYALVIILLLRWIVYYRSQRLLKENRVLEEKVEHRTNQLKQSIEDLKSTQSQLIQSEKMASLGELAAGIAHEIQNPLNFVNNFSEVNAELIDELKGELSKPNLSEEDKTNITDLANDIKQNQEKISFHGKRADSIVKGMLQHSRSSTGVKEPTNINNLADEYLRLAYHGLRAKDKTFNATMKTDFDEHVGSINVIPQDLGRVILNLITNAFYSVTEKKKQQPEGSGYEPTVVVSTKKFLNKIEIAVQDNGTGIPQKVLDKIYQPFFTTKPTGQGTGLGLSMSYEIITKGHGGDLKVETKEGEGAKFIIILPA